MFKTFAEHILYEGYNTVDFIKIKFPVYWKMTTNLNINLYMSYIWIFRNKISHRPILKLMKSD